MSMCHQPVLWCAQHLELTRLHATVLMVEYSDGAKSNLHEEAKLEDLPMPKMRQDCCHTPCSLTRDCVSDRPRFQPYLARRSTGSLLTFMYSTCQADSVTTRCDASTVMLYI